MCRSLYCYMNMEKTMFVWLSCLFLDPINSLPWTYIWKMNIDMSVFVSLKTDIAFFLCHYCPFKFLWTPCYVLGGHLQCNGTRPNVCLWAFAHCHTLVHVQYTRGKPLPLVLKDACMLINMFFSGTDLFEYMWRTNDTASPALKLFVSFQK